VIQNFAWTRPLRFCDLGAMRDSGQIVGESFVLLHAVDLQRNVARAYRIEMSTDLFGATIVDYAWGRIGAAGRCRRVSFEARSEALHFVRGLLRRRSSARQRIGVGYSVVAGSWVLSAS